jgi:hypothetical protein
MSTISRKIVQVSAVLALLTALLLLGCRVVPALGLLTLPVSWPGLIILGADETQERFGYWGELILFWLCSMPCIMAYAWLWCRWWGRQRVSSAQNL